MWRYAKELLFGAYFLAVLPSLFVRLNAAETPLAVISILLLFLTLWVCLYAAAYIRPAALRWGMAAILSFFAYYLDVYERVTTEFMTYDAFINVLNSAAFFRDALGQYGSNFLHGIWPTILLLVALVWPPSRLLRFMPPWLNFLLPWSAVALLSTVLFIRGGEGARALPPSFTPMAYLTLAGYEALTDKFAPRQPIQIERAPTLLERNIVLIVDESVAGMYLDVNSQHGVPTPFSKQSPGLGIFNYGVAASITNCSYGSNVALRYGGTRSDYQRIDATGPSIWAYAKKAGLRTVYIDAQRQGGTFQNMMTDEEHAQIDQFVQFDGVSVRERDHAAAQELIKQLADPKPKFIYVNKMGAHFPVHDKYPDSHLRYRPSLDRVGLTGISDLANTSGFSGNRRDWVLYRNSYRNTLLWNVSAFFEILFAKANLSKTTMIYTSDHGQNLHERGNPGTFTQCSPNPAPEEGAVPLLIIEGAGSGIDWGAHLDHNRNHASHYMIFPTLLTLMGYGENAVEQQYGRPLNAPTIDPGTFNALFNGRLNRKPVWVQVDPAKLAQPPLTDIGK